MDVNKLAQETAHTLLNATTAGYNALARHKKRGRTICFKKDKVELAGPLWANDLLTIKDNKNGSCIDV